PDLHGHASEGLRGRQNAASCTDEASHKKLYHVTGPSLLERCAIRRISGDLAIGIEDSCRIIFATNNNGEYAGRTRYARCEQNVALDAITEYLNRCGHRDQAAHGR